MANQHLATVKETLDDAANAIKRGDITRGKQGLEWVLQHDPDNVLAWLWMSRCVERREDKLRCFHRVLAIDPANPHALKALSALGEAQPAPSPQNPTSETGSGEASFQPQSIPKTRRRPNRAVPLLAIVAFGAVCACGLLFVLAQSSLNTNIGTATSAKVLSAQEVFEVSAVDAAQMDGYTVTSSVCEVVSSPTPQRFQQAGWRLVFHAFRLAGPDIGQEKVVLFASNHTALDGAGLVIPVNDEAIALEQGFPPGSELPDRVTVNTPGAQAALECAREVGPPATLEMKGLDPEAWRREAISRFGAEETYDDGSKDDYVRDAVSICGLSADQLATMKANLGAEYQGSFQQFILDTFCPYQ